MNSFPIHYSNYNQFKSDYEQIRSLCEPSRETLKVQVCEHKTDKSMPKVVLKVKKLSQQALHEEKMSKKLNTDYFAQTYFAFMKNDKFYLVMEYVEGQTLTEFIKMKPYATISEYSTIVRKILEGVRAALEQDVFPVDFHSKNIIIKANTCELKFIDFEKYDCLQEFLTISQEITRVCEELKLENDSTPDGPYSLNSNLQGDVESWQNDLDHFRFHVGTFYKHTMTKKLFLKHISFLLEQPLMKYSPS